MYRAYGLTKNQFFQRQRCGWDLEKILTTPVRETPPCKDHLGTKFINIKEMCLAYGIDPAVYHKRKKLGWPLEECLTGKKPYLDHKGNPYPSIKEMCKAYDIPEGRYRDRIFHGYSVEEALTMPPSQGNISPCQDHLGNHYYSQTKMAQAYGLTKEQFLLRKKLGWDLEKILTTPVRKRSRK